MPPRLRITRPLPPPLRWIVGARVEGGGGVGAGIYHMGEMRAEPSDPAEGGTRTGTPEPLLLRSRPSMHNSLCHTYAGQTPAGV